MGRGPRSPSLKSGLEGVGGRTPQTNPRPSLIENTGKDKTVRTAERGAPSRAL